MTGLAECKWLELEMITSNETTFQLSTRKESLEKAEITVPYATFGKPSVFSFNPIYNRCQENNLGSLNFRMTKISKIVVPYLNGLLTFPPEQSSHVFPRFSLILAPFDKTMESCFCP